MSDTATELPSTKPRRARTTLVGRKSLFVNNDRSKELAQRYVSAFVKGVEDPNKPFIGAKPKFLQEPKIVSKEDSELATRLASATIQQLILDAKGVLLVMGQDSSPSHMARKLLFGAKDSAKDVDSLPVSISLNNDWLHTLPRTEYMGPPNSDGRLLIFVGTPGKYLAMCMASELQHDFDDAYQANRLVVITKGAIMLPLGLQEENLFGTDHEKVLDGIINATGARGGCAWVHGVGTKNELLPKAFCHIPSTMHWMDVRQGISQPNPLEPLEAAKSTSLAGEEYNDFDSLASYVKYSNELKTFMPLLDVVNYYDTGLLVSVIQGFVVKSGVSLLTDGDGLGILRDASIGHIISKLVQVTNVEPWASKRGVYNFMIGDGAARLNCGVETAFHAMEDYSGGSYITLLLFNNHVWAIEDNLVADKEEEHILFNTEYYDMISQHPNVRMCNTHADLHEALVETTKEQGEYAMGNAPAKFQIIVARNLDMEVPVLLGDLDPIKTSPEMALMRKVLGEFAAGCEHQVPLYGCSAFEYIQYLKLFLEDMPEGKLYQYRCGRTDIQAAHMCGFNQPEGQCVLFINDVYGINSLGESLRMVQSGLGGKQLLVFIWHPSIMKAIDQFHLHRPPLVWPSLGPTLAKFYVRKEADAVFLDFHARHFEKTAAAVSEAIKAKTPLILINMLPEHEQNFVSLDIRAKVPKE